MHIAKWHQSYIELWKIRNGINTRTIWQNIESVIFRACSDIPIIKRLTCPGGHTNCHGKGDERMPYLKQDKSR